MKLQKLILTALLLALCFVTTMTIQIPILGGGYIHPGDGFVLLSGVLLGPGLGFVSAALGSSLADVALGFSAYAPATFIIKGLMALLVGYLVKRDKAKHVILAFSLAEIVMVIGYFGYDWLVVTGNLKTALAGIIWNLAQAVGGVIIGWFLYLALAKTNLMKLNR